MNQRLSMYTEEEWQVTSTPRPLQELQLTQVMLLHRNWIWACREQELFDAEVRAGRPPRLEEMAEDAVAAMFLWYSLLWSVLEGLEERGIRLKGQLGVDIADITDGLRRCRNAIFHVPRDDYYDSRMFEFMEDVDSGPKVRRISAALGRLLLEEFDARGV
jgi:hypothetical protein